MSATRTEAVAPSDHLGLLKKTLEFVKQKPHNNLTPPNNSTGFSGMTEYAIIKNTTERFPD